MGKMSALRMSPVPVLGLLVLVLPSGGQLQQKVPESLRIGDELTEQNSYRKIPLNRHFFNAVSRRPLELPG